MNQAHSQLNTSQRDTSIGRLLLDLGKLTPQDAERVIRAQKEGGMRFGDAAVKLGFITEADIQQALSLQFDYPYLQPGQGNFSADLVAAYQPFSPQVEALRALRSQLVLRWFADQRRTLVVAGAQAGDGCSHLAANLAVVFSQLGEHTLLIDANLRHPRQRAIFNLNEGHGLSDILARRAGMEAVVRIESFIDLSILAAGTVPPNPQELLNRPAFGELLGQVASAYDVVIIDAPPQRGSADIESIVSRAGGALLVCRKDHTRLADLQLMRDTIKGIGAEVVGVVLNDF